MVFTPPLNITQRDFTKKTVFLAGSIELGKAVDWQTEMGEYFESIDFNVFNPRRRDWDSTWVQDYTNPSFTQQVKWELNALDVADVILMYYDPNTMSPISLLELGLFARSGKIHVICPDGYWRKGNVDIVCDECRVPMYKDLEEFKNFMSKAYASKT